MFFFSRLSYQGPVIFVYLVAGYFSIMYMSRARLPSMLTLIGVIILLVTTFGVLALQFYMNLNMNLNRTDSSWLDNSFEMISYVSGFMRAVGLGLLVAAIFVGRNHTPPADRYLRE